MGFGEEDHRGKVPFSSHHITSHQGYIPSARFMTVDVDLDHLAEVVFVWFLHCKVTRLLLLFFRILWREVIMCSPHLGCGDAV